MTRPFHILLLICISMLFACTRESFTTTGDARISISTDSLHFDTLFASTGSVTQAFKIYNTNKQRLRISSISLAGGAASSFRINADGREGPEATDIEMNANDSLYVFVTVYINPSSAGLPFVVQDSIQVRFNGNTRSVQLDAWGQNGHFLRSEVIDRDTTWTNDKPYIILGSLQVKEGATLTISSGARIYLHTDAPFLVDGSLVVNGEKGDSMDVVFRGDRLDDPYLNYTGAWPGLYFREGSVDNRLRYLRVKNGNQGIVVAGPSINGNPKLRLDNCMIENCLQTGLSASHTDLEAVNCVVTNCGKNIELLNGGHYTLTYCTMAAYSNTMVAHKDPVLRLTDYAVGQNGVATNPLDARFTNCIFWGDNGIVQDEVVIDRQGMDAFTAAFDHCLWKETTEPAGTTLTAIVANQDPLFLNIDTRNNEYDFHPDKGSPAAGAGTDTGVETDFDGNARNPDFPDIGAYLIGF